MKEKINSIELANKSKKASIEMEALRKDNDAKMARGQEEISGVNETVNENLDILAREASMDYTAKLKQDLMQAVDKKDTAGAKIIIDNIAFHQKSMQEFYDSKARENIESYFDSSTGEADMEKLKKELDSFMEETFLMWYGKKDADKAKISGEITDLSELDFDKLMKADEKLYGEYTINPETAGMNHQEKEPKIKILDMKEFVGKPRSEVMESVIEKYGGQYYIPGLEYEKYLLENPDKVPKEIKDGNLYYFIGSTLRGQNGNSNVPCVSWNDSKLYRNAAWLDNEWDGNDRVLLLEK